MARSRNIKPGFFKNEYLSELQPLTRLLFEGLWCWADREGRLEDRPKKIKAEILPYDDCNVDKMLDELQDSKGKFIVRYEVNGDRYIQILNFLKHQTPHKTEVESFMPGLPEYFESTLEVLPNNIESTTEKDRKSSVKGISNKESVIRKEGVIGGDNIPFAEIIEYLNERAGTKYRHTSKATQELIKARWKEKYSFEDFKQVIENKAAEWYGTDQEKYLRPETLFSAKHFESYLNQKNKPPGKKSSLDFLKEMYEEAGNEQAGNN